MPKTDRRSLHVLLMQIRQEDDVRREEVESFARHAGLDVSQIDSLDVFVDEMPAHLPEHYDALFVGGSSSASVLEPETYSFVAPARRLLRSAIDHRRPVFASCFGFQLAVLELGGEVVRETGAFEMGTLPIEVLPSAADDPVFGQGPRSLRAVSVHRESAREVPVGCIELARTDLCCHAFRVQGAPFWAFQFHPELDHERLAERLTAYKAKYTGDDGELDAVIASLVPVAEANALVANFIERVLLSRG